MARALNRFAFILLLAILGDVRGVSAAPGLNWEPFGPHRIARLQVDAKPGAVGFTRVPGAQSGVTFTNLLANSRSITNRNLLSGSGVAIGDVDGDGWADVYFCGLDAENRLYRNHGGWRFEDVTARSGAALACAGEDATAAALADVDGDRDLDLLVNSLASGTRLFVNDGQGRFAETTDLAGLRSRSASMSMALADVDGDGDLDLYVTNFRRTTVRDQMQTRFQVRMVEGRPEIAMVNDRPTSAPDLTNRFFVAPNGTIMELGEADNFYLNDGRGRFTPVSFTGGAFLDEEGQRLREPPQDWGLAVQFHDFTGDGLPDIYVCNDLFTPDRIWVNQGGGRFRAIERLAVRSISTFSMGVDFGDLNRDGAVDLFVVDMMSREHAKRNVQLSESAPGRLPPVGVIDNRPQLLRNTLHVNRGDSTFAEAAWHAGLEASDWSWGPIFLDVDLDGYEDILVTNGQWRDFQNIDLANQIESARAGRTLSQPELAKLLDLYPRLNTPNAAFRNRGDLTFEDIGSRWGFALPGVSQGMAIGDLDNDGDLDVAINNLNDEAFLLRNDAAAGRLAVRLRGIAPNTEGVGARLHVRGARVDQTQEIICAGRYLSADAAARVFAADPAGELEVEVVWRSGTRTHVSKVPANSWIEIQEPAGAPPPVAGSAPSTSTPARPGPELFEDLSAWLSHTHTEEAFDDMQRQPLLPYFLSQLGPGVAWHDADGDGWEDLFIGSGRGGRLAGFRNQGGTAFVAMTNAPLMRVVGRDLTAVIGSGTLVLAGSCNYEDGGTNGGWLRICDLRSGASGDSLLGQRSSVGPLVMADVDADGTLEIFTGGRVVPGRYPEPADSILVRGEGGRMVVTRRWPALGLVSGAVFTDLDDDGFPELVLACEWGPIRVFRNNRGELTEVTEAMGLAETRGWWTGVTAGDFDGDGRMDLVAANWGSNTRYRATRAHPQVLRYGDLDGNGVVDLISSRYDETLGKEVPLRWLRAVAAALPQVTQQTPTFERYGLSSVEEIYGDLLRRASRLEANTLHSTLFLNRGDRFEARPLPLDAQLAVAMGLAVADFNGDGREDLFVGQNFAQVNTDDSRSDAGRGLLLLGDGQGGFRSASAGESGVRVYGDQRGCAVADFDADARPDLVVTQNGAPTRLFRNRQAHPGVRVRLRGPHAANPHAIGARLRIESGGRPGPAREVRAGGGYWSQDGAVTVLAVPAAGGRLLVRWPGGKATASPIPADAREVEVTADGSLTVTRR